MSDTGSSSLTWNEFCLLLDRSWCEHPRSHAGDRLPHRLRASTQFFFESNARKQELEAWCVKLSGIRELCLCLADEHEQTRCARGAIDPEQMVVQFPERPVGVLPMCWSATVSLTPKDHDLLPTHDNMPAEMAAGLTLIPTSTNLAYAARQIREWPMGKTISATVLVQAVDPIPEEDPACMRGLVRVHVIVDDLQATAFSDRDVFRIALPLSEQRGACVDLWTRKVESPERGIIVIGQTDLLSLDEWKTLTGVVGMARSSVDIAVYRAVSPADDVYSCGMLLLRALLGTDELRWTRASEQLPSIVEGLQPVVQGLDEDDHYAIHVRIKERVRESSDCFEARGGIPEALWWDAVVALFRACSSIRGFSAASDSVTYDPSPARRLAKALESLARRVRSELFDADERDVMVLRACERAMDRCAAGVS